MIFELIDIAMGRKDSFSRNPDAKDWENLFGIAQRQAVLGVLSKALDIVPANQSAPLGVYAKWMFIKEKIVKSNELAKSRCRDIHSIMRTAGKRGCILKGQSVSLCYPEPELRQSGDIDVWIDDDWKSTLAWAKERFKTKDLLYHHIEADVFPDIKVELHFRPSWMNSSLHNRKLQKYFLSTAEKEFTNFNEELGFCTTDAQFTAILSVIHTFRHFFAEGVGLRQLMDCHYSILRLSEKERLAVMENLRDLGLAGFSSALMFVLEKVFSLDPDHLLCAPDAGKGTTLLNEVMLAGNFGKYDKRYEGMLDESLLKRGTMKIMRISRFFDMAPMEVICAPLFKTWQHLWRKRFSGR